jgi:Tetratricopeptide Repeats-Sensor
MRAFIVRPFGVKEGLDFDRVESELIAPALERLRAQFDIEGSTTGEFIRQGNIREDMFRLLVTADLVIADVSIHNPNVFYELGIRHGLQPRHTFLLREKSTAALYPFDLQTDRYFVYDAADLAGNVVRLAAALRSTLGADSRQKDSPVFQLLPALKAHDRAVLMAVPLDFRDDVEIARKSGQRGDLRLLADEAQGFQWESEGLRLVGEAQFKLKAFRGAKETFEALRRSLPDDVHVNLRLGTIYQKLSSTAPPDQREDLLTRSDLAIRNALACATTAQDRAEAYSLLASNAKTRWLDDWRDAAPDKRRGAALGSAYLHEALMAYLKAFVEDLTGSFYPGANALAMLKIQTGLAELVPDIWEAGFADSDEARGALKDRDACAAKIASVLNLTLGMDPLLGAKEGESDPWAAITRSDLLFMTIDKPKRIESEYRRAFTLARNDPFALSAARRNIELFESLDLRPENVKAALGVIDAALRDADKTPTMERPPRVVLFTGHMVDKPDRPPDQMRFPPTAKAESTARAMIERALRAELAQEGGVASGIAGGACGGDILFHEVCAELGIPTRLFLALPQLDFQVASVQRGGPEWVERFRNLCERVPTRVLQDFEALPRWLTDKPDYDVWQRSNRWMMFNALGTGARHLTLVALYNRDREPDGPGGTAHLVRAAQAWGFKAIELDARALLAE